MPEGDSIPIAKAFPAAMVAMEHNIKGSAVGNQREANEILEMAARGIVKTKLRIEKMDKLTEVFQDMSEERCKEELCLISNKETCTVFLEKIAKNKGRRARLYRIPIRQLHFVKEGFA
jgi:hypothetical protein